MHWITLHGLAPELLPCFLFSYCYKSYIHLFSDLLTCVKEKGNVFVIDWSPTCSQQCRDWMLALSGLTSHTCRPNVWMNGLLFLFTFMFTLVCDDVWIFSIIVSHRLVPSDWFSPLWTMMSIFVVTDWTVGLTEEELANGDSSSGQLRCQAPHVPLHLHRSDGLNAGTVQKARWFRWLESDGRYIMKGDHISLEDDSIPLWHITTTTHNLHYSV